LLKNKIELFLRYSLEKNFSFLTYRTTPKDIIYNFHHSVSFKDFASFLFIPDADIHKEANFSPWGYTSVPDELNKKFNIPKKTKKYAADYIMRVQGSAANIRPTLKLWKFLINEFQSRGTVIFLLRLPKDKVIINAENTITNEYFQGLKRIAADSNVYYIDLTYSEYIDDFRNSFIDGAHWSNNGAVKLSELLSIIIQKKLEKRNSEKKHINHTMKNLK